MEDKLPDPAAGAPAKDAGAPLSIGPWKRLSTRPVYDNPWIRVREDSILHPDGSPGIYGVVEFKNMAVGVVALDAEGRVCLVGQFRYPLNRYSWEIPEGGCSIPEGEAPLQAAIRELQEETGFSAARWDYLGSLALSNSVTNETGHLFLARELTPGRAAPEPSEELTLRFAPFEEALGMAMDGTITDSVSVVALARAAHFLKRTNTPA